MSLDSLANEDWSTSTLAQGRNIVAAESAYAYVTTTEPKKSVWLNVR